MDVLSKACDILRIMVSNPDKKYWRATEISNDLDMNVSTVYRLLQGMKKNSFVAQNPNTKKYYLGIGFIYFAEIVKENNIVGEIMLPFLEKLYNEIKESVFIAIKEGDNSLVIERINSRHELCIVKQIGDIYKITETAFGKVLLAYQPEGIRKRILGENDNAINIEEILKGIRVRGYHYEEDVVKQLTTFSAPIFSTKGVIIASLSAVIPNYRLDDSKTKTTISKLLNITEKLI